MKKWVIIGIISVVILVIGGCTLLISSISENSNTIDEYNKNVDVVRADLVEIGNIATKVETLGEQMSKGINIPVSDLKDASDQLTQKCDSSKPDFDRYKLFVDNNKQALESAGVNTFDGIKAIDDIIVTCQIQTKVINDAIKTIF
ncbi:hypothetical protein J4404_02045 [Candidatus Woesearchaeota archaeon]|nr:hypothetical protein [Candidatus Woesearchaeota archaeon]